MAVWSSPLPVLTPLVTLVVNRAQTDFDRLFEEFADPIYGYVLRMVGDPDRAADIVQDTFIKAHRHLGSLTDPGAARSWIFRIATNTAIDALRRGRWSTPMGESADRYEQRPDPRPGPEAQLLDATLDDRLQRALLALRPNHRQCLLLSDLEDMSAEQIGAVMGLSHGAVRTLLCRARGEMRRLLAAEGMTR
ncbi:MAG TPA: sigma-70 family RNA polymerase sigma factor [Candidatus Limnocylindria bacterium]|nr:sigma-70 family RNA polymerase sigma factor [Candidatus Limnocylindria bacterium]